MQIIYFCFCCIWFAFHILKKLWNYCQQTTGSDNSLPVLHTIAMQLASSVRRRCASGDATISVLLLFAGIRCCYLPFLNISIAAARGCTVQRCLPNLLYFYRLSTVRALLHCLLLFKTLLAFGCFPVLLLSFLVSACRLLAGLVWHSFMQIYNSSSAIAAFTYIQTLVEAAKLPLFRIFSHYLFSCECFFPSAYRSVQTSCKNHSKSQHTSRRCFMLHIAFLVLLF